MDFSAGIKGVISCICAGKLSVANPLINSNKGEKIIPTIFSRVGIFFSKKILTKLTAHVKKIKDSYKLLKGNDLN